MVRVTYYYSVAILQCAECRASIFVSVCDVCVCVFNVDLVCACQFRFCFYFIVSVMNSFQHPTLNNSLTINRPFVWPFFYRSCVEMMSDDHFDFKNVRAFLISTSDNQKNLWRNLMI